MTKKILIDLLKLISQLSPSEWQKVKIYVDKKYSSKQAQVPLPSLEELKQFSNFDFPEFKNQQSECGKD